MKISKVQGQQQNLYNAFYILNSRSRFSKSPFKRAISDETDQIRERPTIFRWDKSCGFCKKNLICWFYFRTPECNRNVPKFTFKW